VSLVGAYATFVWFAWLDRREHEIPADEVARIDRTNRARRLKRLRAEARAERQPAAEPAR
jgi:cytochrome o ubiquinol oxidase subunit I